MDRHEDCILSIQVNKFLGEAAPNEDGLNIGEYEVRVVTWGGPVTHIQDASAMPFKRNEMGTYDKLFRERVRLLRLKN